MTAVRRTFELPDRNRLVDESRRISQAWSWFLREIKERLSPLGIEKNFTIANNINAKTFASGDVNTSSDEITESSHGFYTGLVGQLTTTGTLPTGLSASTDYYIIKVDDNTYQLATSKANADAGTQINITGAGSGNHTFTPRGDVDGLKFNKSVVTCAMVDFFIQRVTTGGGAVEYLEAGFFIVNYRPTSDDWDINLVEINTPDNSGVDFTIQSDGQVQYTSTNIGGAASISSMAFRARTLGGKNAQFSTFGGR